MKYQVSHEISRKVEIIQCKFGIQSIVSVVIFLKHSIVVKGTESGASLPGLDCQVCIFLAVWPWANYLASLCLSFPCCKLRIVIIATTLNCCEN